MPRACLRFSYLLFPVAAWAIASSGCGSSDSAPSDVDGGAPQGAGDAAPAADAASSFPDGGPCMPGADTLVCASSTTLSLCTDDTNFDGTPDGPATTITITCKEFFRNAGAASCEPFDSSTTEALCTMDDGGPCGVFTVTGAITTARCTTDDAICLLDPAFDNGPGVSKGNYICSPNGGIACTPAGDAFVPFCNGERLVWRCNDDGDGIGLPRVDDCAALGNGTCNAAENKCTNIQLGGTCNTTEWICGAGLRCESGLCVGQ